MRDELTVVAEPRDDGPPVEFPVTAQVDTLAAVKYVENGGILQYVVRLRLPE